MMYTEMRIDLNVLKMAESSMYPRRTSELFYIGPQWLATLVHQSTQRYSYKPF